MAISVSKFKQDCLELIRRVERTGRPVTITRRGTVVARLMPSSLPDTRSADRPWQQLRNLGGRLKGDPGESVLTDDDFEALR